MRNISEGIMHPEWIMHPKGTLREGILYPKGILRERILNQERFCAMGFCTRTDFNRRDFDSKVKGPEGEKSEDEASVSPPGTPTHILIQFGNWV